MKRSRQKIGAIFFSAIAAGSFVAPAGGLSSANLSQATQSSSPAIQGKNLVAAVAGEETFSTLAQLLAAAGLSETLSKQGPYTLLAPTDKAFATLPGGTLQKLLQPANRQKLVTLLEYHLLPGYLTSSKLEATSQLEPPRKVETVEGKPVTIKVTIKTDRKLDSTINQISVNKAQVVQIDIPAKNGVIHAIDKVLLPPKFSLKKLSS